MLFDQISNDIKEAMKACASRVQNQASLDSAEAQPSLDEVKARDKVRLETLRNIKKVFLEAKTAPGAGDELKDDAAMKLLQKLAKQGRESAAIFTQQNRPDLAEGEMAQVAVIEEYLPKPLTDAEIEAEVKAVIAEVGATSMKDMGKVMGICSKKLAGQADGGKISQFVKAALS